MKFSLKRSKKTMPVLNNGKLTISRGNSSSEEELLNILYIGIEGLIVQLKIQVLAFCLRLFICLSLVFSTL